MPRFSRLLRSLLPALLLAAALAPRAVRAQAGADFALRDGDRVVFYGDSITDQRLYTTFVETYAVTRFPRRNIRFVHSGWGGDRVSGGGGGPIDTRLDRDVIAYKPTVMTIMLGMNDAGYRAFDQGIFDTYANGTRHIVEKVTKALPGVRLTLIQPSPYDDVTRAPNFEGGYNAVLVRYGQFLGELARARGATLADLNTSVVAALQKANAADAATAQKIVPDRVHPGPGGHLLMAEALLKAWNAPAVVTAVEIDGANARLTRAENASVGALARRAGALTWSQTDNALPFPIDMSDAPLALAVRSSDVVEALDRQPLMVTGLMEGRYTLKIDGDEVGTFTNAELAAGVNLATLSTPMTKQAAAVHALTLAHNNLHFLRWRQVQVPNGKYADSAGMKRALAGLDALEEEMVREQRAAAQPKTRRYELTPQS